MKRFILNPSVLFPAIWITIILASIISGLEFDPYSDVFYSYLSVAIGLFCLSAYCARTCVRSRWRFSVVRDYGLTSRFSTGQLALGYAVFMFIGLVFQAIDRWLFVGRDWWLPAGLNNYRTNLIDQEQPSHFPIIAALNYFFFSAIPFLAAYHRRIARIGTLAILVMLGIYIYLSTARASLFVSVLLGVFFLSHKRLNTWVLGTSMLLLFFLFEVLGGVVGKTSSGDIDSFWLYTLAPSHALDQITQGHRADWESTVFTFRPLHGILVKLALLDPQPMVWSYYQTPYSTNVTTLFGPYLLDYGWGGSLAWVCLFGLVSGTLHELSQRFPKNNYLTFLSSLNLTILTLGVFYDYYTSSSFVWISVVVAPFFFGKHAGDLVNSSAQRREPASPSDPMIQKGQHSLVRH